jgi:hypothetical protein
MIRSSGTEPTYIQNQEERQGLDRWLKWWYRLTAPVSPEPGASFEVRELARRGRLASTIMFFLGFILVVLVAPIGAFGPNHQILLVALGIFVLIIVCAPLNRAGHVNVVGLIISLSVNLGIYSSILRSPGGIAPDTIAIFDMLVFSEVFVASLLPINWVIPDALVNMIFSYVVLTYWPRTPLLAQIMHGSGYFTIVSRPIQIHLIVTVVLYLWVQSATRSIRRADRAEEIAKLQHDIAAQEHEIVEEKRQLDQSIQDIMQTHMQASNGDLAARVPLREGATLWPLAVSLNNLLSRMQRLQNTEQEVQKMTPRIHRAAQVEHELQRIQSAILQISEALRVAEETLKPIRVANTGTSIDALSIELLDKYVLSLPHETREPILAFLSQERTRHQQSAQSHT